MIMGVVNLTCLIIGRRRMLEGGLGEEFEPLCLLHLCDDQLD